MGEGEIPVPLASNVKQWRIDLNRRELKLTKLGIKVPFYENPIRMNGNSERVKVVVRSRPLSQKELDDGHVSVVDVSLERGEIEVRRLPPSNRSAQQQDQPKLFAFDAVFDQRINQKGLYDAAVRPLVDSVLAGFNGTIFAYGQTGTGKTFTMEGIRGNEELEGVIPNAFKHIFNEISSQPGRRYLVRASYLEIYQEEIRDLLCKQGVRTCEVKEGKGGGPYVRNLSSFLCGTIGEMDELMSRGNKSRSTGATNMNEHSSRSHAIFTITIEASEEIEGRTTFRVGKLNLVDLAGSERQGKTGATGARLKEATKINLSLSALGNVIGALAEGRARHVPYRDSKLTRLLQDSLGGNSRTVMVATIGPASFNWDETVTTLRYASRAKRIKNKPKVNEDPKEAMLREYQEEIARLRHQLEAQMSRRGKNRGESRSSSGSSGSGIGDNRHHLGDLLKPIGLDVRAEADTREILSQLEERRLALLKHGETAQEEKARVLKKVEETEERAHSAETECRTLTDRISWLESKVLNGGKSLLDHTKEQERLLEEKREELASQRAREEQMRLKLEEQHLSAKELRAAKDAMVLDLEGKRKKLKNLCLKVKSTREELGASHEAYASKAGQIEGVKMEMDKEVKLKRNVVHNFIHPAERKLSESRVLFQDDNPILLPSPHIDKLLRPQNPPIENIIVLRPIRLQPTREKLNPLLGKILAQTLEEIEKPVTINCAGLKKR